MSLWPDFTRRPLAGPPTIPPFSGPSRAGFFTAGAAIPSATASAVADMAVLAIYRRGEVNSPEYQRGMIASRALSGYTNER